MRLDKASGKGKKKEHIYDRANSRYIIFLVADTPVVARFDIRKRGWKDRVME